MYRRHQRKKNTNCATCSPRATLQYVQHRCCSIITQVFQHVQHRCCYITACATQVLELLPVLTNLVSQDSAKFSAFLVLKSYTSLWITVIPTNLRDCVTASEEQQAVQATILPPNIFCLHLENN